MRELDVEIPSQGLIETLRERIAELEDLEARGAATPDSCEMLVDLQELLDETLQDVVGACWQDVALTRLDLRERRPTRTFEMKIKSAPWVFVVHIRMLTGRLARA